MKRFYTHDQRMAMNSNYNKSNHSIINNYNPKQLHLRAKRSTLHIQQLIRINKQYLGKADQVANSLFKDIKILKVNDNTEIILACPTVTGSNVYDLMSDAIATSTIRVKGHRLLIFHEFTKPIYKTIVPGEIFGSNRCRNIIA